MNPITPPLPNLSRLLPFLTILATISPVSADIVISELMPHPAPIEGTEAVEQEFIELWNTGDETVDLTGWRFDRGIRFTFPSVTLEPDKRLIVAADPTQGIFASITPKFGPWTGRLSNRGERVRLVDPSGETIDEVRYADSGDWAARQHVSLSGQLSWEWSAPFDGLGFSLELVDASLPNDNGLNWAPSIAHGGTPGLTNTQAATDQPALIADVSHHPAVPRSREEVIVRATIQGPAETITLHYRESATEAHSFRSIPMTLEYDNVYAAAIPPHDDQSVIEFYVATESATGERLWPSASGPDGANALYQVDDSPEPSDQPYYRVVMPVAEDLRFRPGTFPNGSNAQMNATFITTRKGETSIRYQAGLRRRGNGSRSRSPRSFRLTLPTDKPWRSITALNLVSQYSYLQALGLHLFKAADLPAPDAILVQLRLNGINYANSGNRNGVHYGSYAHIQPLNGEFLDQELPDDANGDLYKKVSANPSRDRKRWGVHFEETVVYNNPNWYITDRWTKESNRSANDWSRFQSFILAMNGAPDSETYFQTVADSIHVDQWLRWFALMNLLNNNETNLSNGIDDDYSIYQGVTEPRVRLLPHDLDTIFGLGDSSTRVDATIFQMLDARFGNGAATIPQLVPFFNHPEVRPRYYQQLHELMETVLLPEKLDLLVDSLLPHVPDEVRSRIKSFNRQRISHVRSVVEAPLEVDPPDLPESDGIYESILPIVTLQGSVSPRLVTRVTINGTETDFNRGTGTWSAANYELQGGFNTLTILAHDSNGTVLHEGSLLIDSLAPERDEFPKVLEEDLTIDPARGTFVIRETLTVPSGRTLTIPGGATLSFEENASLVIDGTLLIQGTAARPVALTGRENALWDGILLRNSTDSRLAHLSLRDLNEDAVAFTLTNSYVDIAHLDLSSHRGQGFDLTDSSLSLTDSDCRPGEASIIGSGALAGFPFLLTNNVLGTVTLVDRAQDATAPIILEGNAFTEGDVAVRLAGPARFVDNTFQGVQTAVQLDGGELLLANGRFLNLGAVIDFTASAEITIEHCVFDSVEALFAAGTADLQALVMNSVMTDLNRAIPPTRTPASFIQFNHNYLAPNIASTLQTANVRPGVVIEGTDPGYEDDFMLSASSPAKGASTHGQDLGIVDRSEPAIIGKPLERTSSRSLVLGFYGSGWEQVEYRLDGSAWLVLPIPLLPERGQFREAFLPLQDLADGEHTLDVREREGAPTSRLSWIIGEGTSSVLINEVAASNTHTEIDGAFPDWVELHNPGTEAIDLVNYQLGGRGTGRITLGDDARIEAGRYLVVPLITTDQGGFALDRSGETLTLYSPIGAIIDRIAFGAQIDTHTLGRLPSDPNQWSLTEPTPNSFNQLTVLGSPFGARINEWYAASGGALESEFLEFANATPWPIKLDALTVADERSRSAPPFEFPAHSFLASDGHLVLDPSSLGFQLDAWFESITIRDPVAGQVVDQVFSQGEHSLTSTGRVPDAVGPWQPLAQPSAGRSNDPGDSANLVTLFDWESQWKFYQSPEPPGADWVSLDFTDSDWPTGTGAFHQERSALSITKNTELQLNPPHTHAFRQAFEISDPSTFQSLQLYLLVDDGAVVYLNGTEVLRLRMPDGAPVPYDTFATDTTGNASIEGPFPIDASLLTNGKNVLAVSVHQGSSTSSDVVFAARLQGEPAPMNGGSQADSATVRDQLRISEIQYHPEPGQAEWLELLNVGSTPLDLGGLQFAQGLTFTFPPGTGLQAGERAVLVSDEAAFQAQYGDTIRILGVFTGRLDNIGETISLTNAPYHDERLLLLEYRPSWYPLTDGQGHTLVMRNEARPNLPARADWRAGDVLGGTPGNAESPLIYSNNQTKTILGDLVLYQIEATNEPSTFAVDDLPPGLSFDSGSGLISGSIAAFGNFTTTIRASNASGETTRLWHLQVASSGPLASIQWEDIPESIVQNAPFELVLTARDNANRLVRDLADTLQFEATVERGAGPPVLIREIRDSGADGLTLIKLDPEFDTSAWTLLLNSAADGNLTRVHGVNAAGRVYPLPSNFTTLDLNEGDLGFNLQWSDDDPSTRQGGQAGWALVVDENQQAVDFVAWGYSEAQLKQFSPRNAEGSLIGGELWKGAGIAHPATGQVLSRTSALDSDSSQDWIWVDRNAAPEVLPPSKRIESFPFAILDQSPFEDGQATATMQSSAFGSGVRIRARIMPSDYQTVTPPITALPEGPPSLPADVELQAVEGQPIALPTLIDPLTESLALEGLNGQISLVNGRPIATFSESGIFDTQIVASNAVGQSVTEAKVTVLTDTDSDGLPDRWEADFGVEDPFLDNDSDGVDNLTEYLGRTNPNDASSRLSLIELSNVSDEVRVRWSAIPGHAYTVESGKAVRGQLIWEPIHNGWILPDSETASLRFLHGLKRGSDGELLRVRVWDTGQP